MKIKKLKILFLALFSVSFASAMLINPPKEDISIKMHNLFCNKDFLSEEDYAIFKCWVSLGADINFFGASGSGHTILGLAVIRGNSKGVKAFLDLKADVSKGFMDDMDTKKYSSPLHLITKPTCCNMSMDRNQRRDIVGHLLTAKADPFQKDKAGIDSLGYLSQLEYFKVADDAMPQYLTEDQISENALLSAMIIGFKSSVEI